MSKSLSKNSAEALPTVNGAKLAAIAGLGVRQFNRLVRAGHIPKAKRGLYDTEAALAAIVTYYRQGKEGSSHIAAEKLRLTISQRLEIEQRTQTRARELIPVTQVRAAFDTAMTLIGSQLDGLAGRIANDVAATSDPAICKKVIFDETRRIRTAAAAELETLSRPSGGGESAPAAAGNKRG
jgi:phage terminase Nu1 subunit (DNA packaging protein)